MCICKRSSSKNSTTTRRTINKGVSPPPPPPTRRFKGMPPPAAPTHATTSPPAAAAVPGALSTSQLSAILDPFFIDTCEFLREASGEERQQATFSTADINSHHQRIEHAFLSGPAVVGEATEYARHEAKKAAGNGGGSGGGALDSFALLSSAAWMGAVQDMEAEKNDMLRLDVRFSSC